MCASAVQYPIAKRNPGSSSQENAGEEVADKAEEEKPKQGQQYQRFSGVFGTETETSMFDCQNPNPASVTRPIVSLEQGVRGWVVQDVLHPPWHGEYDCCNSVCCYSFCTAVLQPLLVLPLLRVEALLRPVVVEAMLLIIVLVVVVVVAAAAAVVVVVAAVVVVGGWC